ncbi:MAG TPA: alpha/beta hydrolase [Ktedonobacterales bacterium]|nr:alpha/beta hydrolase [Ktedonobacterales bacterium]
MPKVRSNDGTPIAFDRSGAGPALIMVSGAFSHRAMIPPAPEPAEPAASRFTMYSYDRRGRGESGDTAPYAVEREVEDIEALINDAGGSAFVYGHSSGAVLALEAARLLPGKITKLAVHEPPFFVDGSHPPLPDDYVAHLNALIAAGRRGDAVEYFMTAAMSMPPEAVASMRQEPMWPALEAVAHTLPYDGAIMGDTMSGSPEPLKRWASLTIPVLVMDGGASPAFMHNAAQALTDILPNAHRRTLEGQDHGVSMDVLAPVLEAFFLS